MWVCHEVPRMQENPTLLMKTDNLLWIDYDNDDDDDDDNADEIMMTMIMLTITMTVIAARSGNDGTD